MNAINGQVTIWHSTTGSMPAGYNIENYDNLVLASTVSKTALLATLGIPTYANDAAAATGGVLVGEVYYTGTKIDTRTV